MVGQDVLVVLEVLSHLAPVRVFQQGFQPLQCGIAVKLLGRSHVIVGQRQVGRLAGFDREGHTHNFGIAVAEAGGLGIEGEQLGGFQPGEPAVQLGLRQEGFVVPFRRSGGGRACFHGSVIGTAVTGILRDPGLEFVLPEEFQQLFTVLGLRRYFLDAEFQLHIGAYGRQFATQWQVAKGIPEVVTNLAPNVVGVGHQVVQITVLSQPFDGGFGATLGHARNIVHGVTHQGEVVHHLLWGNTELVLHTLTVHAGFGHGVDQGDMVADQLGHILVTGGNDHIHALAGGFRGQGANDIVRLHVGDNQQWQPHGADNLVDGGDLLAQVFRHRRTVGLVLLVQVVAEGLALGIEHHHHLGAREVLLQPSQHADHAFDGPGGVALTGGQGGQGMVGPEQVGGTVDEDNGRRLLLAHIRGNPESD